jgi:hypothetical protein
VATPGPSLKDSRNIADWLPLLGSIVQALSGMAEDDDRPIERPPATTRGGEARPDKAAP